MKSTAKRKAAKKVVGTHGGYRPGAGRKGPPDPENWGPVTCTLRLRTIQALRDGAGTKAFGSFLQWWLDRNPLPSHEVYQAIINNQPVVERVRGKRTQVLYAGSTTQPKRRNLPGQRADRETRRSIAELLKDRLAVKYGPHDGNGKDSQG